MNARIKTKRTLAVTKKAGKVEGTTANVASILRAHPAWEGVIGFNEFSGRVYALEETPMREQDAPAESTIGEWTDAHTTRLRTWIAGEYECEPAKENTDNAVELVARANSYHPVTDYLASLEWDGRPRLDSLLAEYFGAAPSRYSSLIGSKFMISAVARVAKPGCKVDTMMILEGPQGTLKSSAVKVLASAPWFADTLLDFESKDAAQGIQGKWIYEIGELASFSRSEVTRIKAFVSSPVDDFRPSYGRRNVSCPRQCVFVGTTNDDKYLTDTTGNRRYWPVKCGTINLEALTRDRDQLWSEAAQRYADGERWWLRGDEETLASEQQASREAIDPWESMIDRWLTNHPQKNTMPEILEQGLQLGTKDQSAASARRVGQLLRKLGYERKNKRTKAGFVKCYSRN